MKVNNIILVFFTIALIVCTNMYSQSMGGQGFSQTLVSVNSVSHIILATLSIFLLSTKTSFFSSSRIWALIGIAVAIYVSSLFHLNREWDTPLAILAVLQVIFVAILCLQLTKNQLQLLAGIVVISAFIQSLVGIYQVHFVKNIPNIIHYNINYGRPYGIFNQVNLFASYLSTGVGFTIYLLFTQQHNRNTKPILGLALIPMLYALYLADSRTGWLSILVLASLVALKVIVDRKAMQFEVNKKRILFSILILVIFTSLLNYSFKEDNIQSNVSTENIEKSGSDEQSVLGRSVASRLFIYSSTIEMIKREPWLGYGYGNYEKAHLEVMADLFSQGKSDRPGWEGLKHPHNLFLYIWAEGGILPILAILYFLFVVVFHLFQQGSKSIIQLACIAPISIHLMTELPFTASPIHILVFSIALSILLYSTREEISLAYQPYIQKGLVATGTLSVIVIFPYLAMYGKSYVDYFTYEKKLPKSMQRDATFLLEINAFEGPLHNKFELLRNQVRFNNAMRSRDKEKIKGTLEHLKGFVEIDHNPQIYRAIVLSYISLKDRDNAEKYLERLSYLFPDSKYLNQLSDYIALIK